MAQRKLTVYLLLLLACLILTPTLYPQAAGVHCVGCEAEGGGGGDITEAEVAAAIQTGQWIAVEGGSGADTYTGTTTPCIDALGTRLVLLFRPDVDNTGASSLTLDLCTGDTGALPIYDGEDANDTSNAQLKTGIDKWLTYCPTCNSAAGAWIGNFAAAPASATWGAIGGTLSNQTDLNNAIAAASIDNLGATAPVTRTGDDFGCATCVVKDGSGNVTVTGDLTVDGSITSGGGGPLYFEATWGAGSNIAGSPGHGFSTVSGTAPAITTATGSNGFPNTYYQFDDTTDESIWFEWKLPYDIKEDENIDGEFYWHGVATSGSVTGGIQLACTHDGETLTQAFGTAAVVVDAAKGTTLQVNRAVITNIPHTDCLQNDILQGRFFRDANASEGGATDDFSGDMFFKMMTIKVGRQL